MKPKHTPPRWFSLFTFACGFFVIIYLGFTEDHIASWAFPTGAFAVTMMAAAAMWFYRRIRPPA